MNIAIIGSEGYIARFLINSLEKNNENKVIRIDKIRKPGTIYLDLENAHLFNYEILNDIDYMIFTAAISGPDKCSSEFDMCWKINVIGTEYFISNGISKGCRVLFFSSDAVFGDKPDSIFNENSITIGQTPYGKMKKYIEDKFKCYVNFKAIRLSYVVSQKDRFVSYCLHCLKNGEVAEIFHPFYRNCICISDVIAVVQWIIMNWDFHDSNFMNIAGKELISRIRIADEINRIYNEQLQYKIINPGEDFYLNRPKITQMESLYLEKFKIIDNNTFTKKFKKEMEKIQYE